MAVVGNQELIPGLKLRLMYRLAPYVSVPPSFSNPNTVALTAGADYHQMLQISLAPGDKIVTEPGAMVMTSGGLKANVDLGGCGQACSRVCIADESLFRLVFENKTQVPQFLAIAPPGPGKVIPLPLEEWSGVTLAKGVFLGAYGDQWTYTLKIATSVTGAFCGGQGLILPNIVGVGTAFIYGSGSVEILSLGEGEHMIVDQKNVVAFQESVRFEARALDDLLTCCCGGMGCFNASFTGPGKVIVQTLPLGKLAAKLGITANNGGESGGADTGGA